MVKIKNLALNHICDTIKSQIDREKKQGKEREKER